MKTLTRETASVNAARTERSRWWLVALVALGLAALGGVIWAISNSDGDDALPDVLEQWEESALAEDAAAMAALYTEDGVHDDRAIPVTLYGRDDIEGAMNEAFAVLTDGEMELLSVEETAESIVTEWRWSGTSAGQEFAVDLEVTFVLDDELIASAELVYDSDSVWFD